MAALAGRIDHAIAHQEAGVDLIIAQGTEGGGHTGEIATMVLVPQVVDAVAPTPVLAAGGIATGRQMAAALALGAEGVWCGSVWLTTHEAETSPVIREKFLAATLRRHAPLALAHRQAGAHAAQRLDRRLGRARRARAAAACRCRACWSPTRSAASTASRTRPTRGARRSSPTSSARWSAR